VFTEVINDETFDQVRIVGWLPIEECGKPEYWDKNYKRYYIPEDTLNDPNTLPL
jgi:hypothetical protein